MAFAGGATMVFAGEADRVRNGGTHGFVLAQLERRIRKANERMALGVRTPSPVGVFSGYCPCVHNRPVPDLPALSVRVPLPEVVQRDLRQEPRGRVQREELGGVPGMDAPVPQQQAQVRRRRNSFPSTASSESVGAVAQAPAALALGSLRLYNAAASGNAAEVAGVRCPSASHTGHMGRMPFVFMAFRPRAQPPCRAVCEA